MLIRPHLSPADNRRIQAMLLGNQNGDLRQQLLDGAALRLDNITHSAIPVTGAVVPNFTRATTKTITDSWGKLVTLQAGELGFPGARRVRNLLTYTEDLTNAAWTKINGGTGTAPVVTAGFTDPDGGSTAFRIQANSGASATGADYSVVRQVMGTTPNSGNRSIYIKSNTGVSQTIYFGVPDNTNSITATTEWQRLEKAATFATAIYDIGCYPGGGTGMGGSTCDVLVWYPQCEDVTGQSDQSAGEYVSVGVESAPAYHGSMVDGVKCFPTDLDGNALTGMTTPLIEAAATNYITQSNNFGAWSPLGTPSATQDAVGPNGQTNYAWTLTDNNAAGWEGVKTTPAFGAGALGCFSALVGKKSSSPAYPLLLAYYNVAGGLATGVIINEVAGTLSAIAGGGYAAPENPLCIDFNDDYWLVSIGMTQAGANLTAACELYPSGSPDGTSLLATAQGSTVFSEAQFEQGTTVPSSRIATAGATATRDDEQFYYTGALIGQLKTLVAIGFRREVGVSGAGAIVALSDGTFNNYNYMYLNSATDAKFEGYASSVEQWKVSASNAYVPGTISSMAVSAATNDVKISKDGVATTSADLLTATPPVVTRLEYGMIGGSQLNGNPGEIYGWARTLSQSELDAVTRT